MNSRTMEFPIKIRAYEIDAMGVVSNTHYVRWFEDLRHEFLDRYYRYSDMITDGLSYVLMHTEVDYLKPLVLSDDPIAKCTITKIEKFRWEISIEIRCGENIHCVGLQQGCFLDLKKNFPTRVPQKLVEAFIDSE